jgi:hypothetical protein
MLVFTMDEDASIDNGSYCVDGVGDQGKPCQRDEKLVAPESCAGTGADDDHCSGAHAVHGTLALMADSSDIRGLLSETSGAVMLGIDGESLDFLELGVPAAPTLLVAPVTDALKTVSDDGIVTGSLDRDDMWRVVAYHLDEKTARQLAEREVGLERIHQEVVDMGLTWQALPIDDLA